MPLSEEKVDSLLAQPPVGPTRIDGSPVRQTHVSPEQARARRQSVSRLLANGKSTDEIIEMMGRAVLKDPLTGESRAGFDLTPEQTTQVIVQVQQMWEEEDAQRKAFRKAAAIRRHHEHITKASKKGAYTAVAMLEGNLSKIEGTAEPLRIEVSDDTRMSEAVLKVLQVADPAKLRALVQQERQRVIEANGETVEILPPRK